MGDMADDGEISFDTEAGRWRHWRLDLDGPTATVTMAVDPEGGLRDDYELKLNSYDLSVDIELYDIVQRLRFEHPEVRVVVVTGGLDKVFCAGANIQMLAGATHNHKVNFCKFTNETRNGIEDATSTSRQVWLAAINGTAAGGGYELALACDEIILIDDRSSTVSLPEVPLLGVLPGTGGLTRVVDKRKVRRDLADVFATRSEGVRGAQAVEWGLVDSVAPRSAFAEHVRERAAARAAASDRPGGPGVTLTPLDRKVTAGGLAYRHVSVDIDRELGAAHIVVRGPAGPQPSTPEELVAAGADGWALASCRELDDAILRMRFNEPEIGTWVLHTEGDRDALAAVDDVLDEHSGHWLVREIRAYWARTLKRLDVSARTLIALIEPGSCFAGTLGELALAADRSFMLDGTFEGRDLPAPALTLTAANDGRYPMGNGLSRLESRFWGHDDALAACRAAFGKELLASECLELGLVTFAPDDIDWDDEIRVTLEERAAFSPDALTGLEANLRFVGPETAETKIFARLSAWQNWIFVRPNASGPDGALRRYGTGSRPSYDRKRV
ncbi:2,3-epoxybenzoyl-CoA dihydrolase [Acidiferrimicrobium sp. IK]|uniref:2,3-epoxybenzoyl-CoA dihydrolase n=1 Tax=Acidiferrimicrobium sp. IK TaxID=2871700 RepID=UPI0021CB7EFE|nr:2,3-epoxybenzoyl-CoA dihydrolase [Acidiferrimicrobium sp. IK]MCU4186850.1 2,3-epoxybenzoyl-CoA dihydrolase [Acidiferrimicrobium sp. IK]